MNKQEYLFLMDSIKSNVKDLETQKKMIVKEYIESNAPGVRGDGVEIELDSGRVVKGFISQVGILIDKGVYVTAYVDQNGRNTKYITKPYKSIKLTGDKIELAVKKEYDDEED